MGQGTAKNAHFPPTAPGQLDVTLTEALHEVLRKFLRNITAAFACFSFSFNALSLLKAKTCTIGVCPAESDLDSTCAHRPLSDVLQLLAAPGRPCAIKGWIQ